MKKTYVKPQVEVCKLMGEISLLAHSDLKGGPQVVGPTPTEDEKLEFD